MKIQQTQRGQIQHNLSDGVLWFRLNVKILWILLIEDPKMVLIQNPIHLTTGELIHLVDDPRFYLRYFSAKVRLKWRLAAMEDRRFQEEAQS